MAFVLNSMKEILIGKRRIKISLEDLKTPGGVVEVFRLEEAVLAIPGVSRKSCGAHGGAPYAPDWLRALA